MNATADNGCYRQYNILSKIKRAAAKGVDYRRRRVISPIVVVITGKGCYHQLRVLLPGMDTITDRKFYRL